MNSICLPVPLVQLLRKLFNAFSAFSVSQHYLTSRWAASSEAPDTPHEPEQGHPTEEPAILTAEAKPSWHFWKSTGRAPRPKALPHIEHDIGLTLERGKEGATSTSFFFSSKQQAIGPSPPEVQSPIHRLISNPTLFDPVRAPRHPIVLCHGLYGFDVRGPEAFPKLRVHYWSNVLHVLRKKVGAEVVVTGVPGTGSIASRAERMDRFLRENVKGREINFLAHSMGGLDCRHLITHIKPKDYTPLSLTSLSVPHRGSPFMDWCLANIGIGSPRPFPFPFSSVASTPPHASSASSNTSPSSDSTSSNSLPYSLRSPLLSRLPLQSSESPSITLSRLPSSFTALILSLIDSPAYANLTTSFLRDRFNPCTPDKPGIKYFSVAARTAKMSMWHPLWLPKLIIDAAEEQEAFAAEREAPAPHRYPHGSEVTVSYPDMDLGRDRDPERGNDGLVTVSSQKWGEFLGTMEGDHWEMRGARGLGADWDEGWGKQWREWIGRWREDENQRERESDKARRDESESVRSDKPNDWATRNGLSSRFDLERFYVALSRKLYDEGL